MTSFRQATAHRPLSAAEIKAQTSLGLASDLLERTLKGPFGQAHITLIQIVDSGLLESDDHFKDTAARLLDRAYLIDERLSDLFPRASRFCRTANGQPIETLAEQVDLFRQEHFWLLRAKRPLTDSEGAIASIFDLYRDVWQLMAEIDAAGIGLQDRALAPVVAPNRYESFGDDRNHTSSATPRSHE